MKRSVGVETDETDGSTEIESLKENTPRRMSDHEVEISPSVSITSEEVACQIKAVFHPLTQQLANLCELMQELKNEQAHRRHEETASLIVARSSTAITGRSDNHFRQKYQKQNILRIFRSVYWCLIKKTPTNRAKPRKFVFGQIFHSFENFII